MNVKLLQFRFPGEDDDFYMVADCPSDNVEIAKAMVKYEGMYLTETPEDEQTMLDMEEYVVNRMREVGYYLIPVEWHDIIYRDYEEEYGL